MSLGNSNNNEYIYLVEAEVIATFYNRDRNVVNIKSYGANNYGKFEAQTSETFTIQSDILTPISVTLVTQCNRYYLEPELEISISGTKLVKHSNVQLNYSNYPAAPLHPVDITFTSPSGYVSVIAVTLNLDSHCTMNINASEIGQRTMQMSSIPLFVNQSKGYVEAAKTEASFTVVEAQIWTYPRIRVRG